MKNVSLAKFRTLLREADLKEKECLAYVEEYIDSCVERKINWTVVGLGVEGELYRVIINENWDGRQPP